MNKFYLIIPCAALGAFVVFQRAAEHARLKKAQAHALEVAALKREADERATAAKKRAQREQLERAEAREQQERERTEKKQRDFEAALQRLNSAASLHATADQTLRREMVAVETQLSALRAQREQVDRDTFTLAQQVEQQRVARRNAELEIQRATRMVATKLLESDGANPPPAAAEPRQ